jgi:hypothetical protein
VTDLTKSERIRQLAAEGMSRSDIAREIGVRYQFVYNVLKAAAIEPLSPKPAPSQSVTGEEGLTIAEAKRRLALTFGVDPGAITITVQG